MNKIELKNEMTIREAVPEDAAQLLTLSKSVMEEEHYMVTRIEELNITIDEEKEWIEEHLDNPGFALFVAEINTRVVGFINFTNGERKSIEHRGSFGVSVEKNMRGLGIGKSLIKNLLEWARNNIIIEKVGLSVFADNYRAIQLYKRIGFVEEGRRKNEIKKANGEYVDDILMHMFV